MPRDTGRAEAPARLEDGRSHRWYAGLAAATAEIDCGAERHRITWRDGKLILEDHDIVAEQSLSALGATPPVCLQVLDAWRRASGDGRILAELLVGRSRPSPQVLAVMKAAHQRRLEHPHEVSERAAERLARERRRWTIALIASLPSAMRRALLLSLLVNVERRWADAEFRRDYAKHIEPALTAIARPLFEQSARRWRRYSNPFARFSLEASLLAPGEAPWCSARADAGGANAFVALSVSWLREVWARGMALVSDSFVTGLESGVDGQTSFGVLAARWERVDWETARWVQAPALVTQGRRGDWRLHWT